MQRISTLFTCLIFSALFFTSCGDKENVGPENCNVVKEYLVSQDSRQLLNEYEYDDFGKILKIKHQETTGAPTESRFEYDSEGRLIKLYDKFSLGENGAPFDGYLEFLYSARGVVYQVDGYKVENDQKSLFQAFVLYYEPNTNLINQVVTSFGERYRFEYDEKGNATKTLYKPETKAEYLLEEYTGYNYEVINTPSEQPLVLRNLFFALRGRSFSQNQVTAYKVYNEDGSLKENYTIDRELNTAGKMVKETTSINTNGITASRIIEKEYPTCK